MGPGMKLYGSYTSPFVRHCRIALLETGTLAEFVETNGAEPSNPSPTRRVPYLEDSGLRLSDSSSIVRFLREKVGQPFLPTVADQELFALANTVLDSAVNVFLFERVDGTLPAQSKYLGRQVDRVARGLDELEAAPLATSQPLGDATLRVACFLAWGVFRKRISLDGHPKLAALLALAEESPHFAATRPPAHLA